MYSIIAGHMYVSLTVETLWGSLGCCCHMYMLEDTPYTYFWINPTNIAAEEVAATVFTNYKDLLHSKLAIPLVIGNWSLVIDNEQKAGVPVLCPRAFSPQ